MRFTWDSAKDGINFRKHGISFETAKEVFSDPFHLVVENDSTATEERMMAIGTVRNLTLVAVVFVDRSAETIHIISARKAVAYEKSIYQEQFD